MVRVHFGPPLQLRIYGGLAQLGERLPCKQEVSGSIPLISTMNGERDEGSGLHGKMGQ